MDFIQPAVHTLDGTDVAFPPAILADFPDAAGQVAIIRGDRPAITHRSEIFSRIKTESSSPCEGSGLPALTGRPMGLGSVFEEDHPVLPALCRKAGNVSRMAVNMHRQHRLDPGPRGRGQSRREAIGMQGKGLRVQIQIQRFSTRPPDG